MAVLLILVKKWKRPECPSTDEWVNKVCSVHTMKYYSAKRRNEILTHAAPWRNLEDMMLSDRRQRRQKTKGHILYESICMKCPEKTDL